MKINWGTAIVLAFIGFISFILFFVVKMNTNEKYEHDLVTEEYYKKELAFQKEIDAEQNAKNLKKDISTRKTAEGLIIYFPEDIDVDKISGTIMMYRPSNKKLDFKIPIRLSHAELIIPNHQLIKGRWNMTIDWTYDNASYLFKHSFTY